MSRRVIFVDPDLWTRKEPMTNPPAAVNRRLTDDERHQLIYHDEVNDAIYVQSLCDLCIEAMGLEPENSVPTAVAKPMVH